jgi:hypothetical protein
MIDRPSFALIALLAACAPPPATPAPLRCPAGASEMAKEVLYFGRSIPGGGEVSDSAWQVFLSEVITPAFPDGFSILEGRGQWRGADGSIASEAGLIFIVHHPVNGAESAKVLQIAERYRVVFHQEAVLHEHSMVCANFITEKR